MKECKICGYSHGGVNCFDAGRSYERDHPVEGDKFKDIVIMADFGSTGLWRLGKKSMCGLMIEYEELGLDKPLIRQFKSWVIAYDRVFIDMAAGRKKTANKFEVDKVNSMGQVLKYTLQRKFPEICFWYYYEDYKGKMIKQLKSSSLSKIFGTVMVGVGVLIIDGDKILLGKRKGSHGSGEWSVPGGHLEMNESFEDCCRREVKEETNLDLKSVEKMAFTNDIFKKNNKHYVTLFFKAIDVDKMNLSKLKRMEPDKCDEWLWFDMNKLPKLLFAPLKKLCLLYDDDKYTGKQL